MINLDKSLKDLSDSVIINAVNERDMRYEIFAKINIKQNSRPQAVFLKAKIGTGAYILVHVPKEE